MSKMPVLPLDEFCDGLDPLPEKLIRAAFIGGKLRTTKPFRRIDLDCADAFFQACANYVWRILCFDYCDFQPHNCMPILADWDINAWHHRKWGGRGREALQRTINDLGVIIEKAEANIPVALQRGALRWLKVI